MAARSDSPDLLQAARCEDLLPNQIREVSVVGPFEEQIISTLKQGGAHLLEGARGTGKSMLLRLAEIQMDSEFATARRLPVYVSFKTSTLLEGVKAGQNESFQVWVNAKILQALHDHLVYLDLIGSAEETDPYKSVFGISSVQRTKDFLRDKIYLLQKLAFAADKQEVLSEIGEEFVARVLDVRLLVDLIHGVIEQFRLERIVFLFDEAAHTFDLTSIFPSRARYILSHSLASV